MDQDNRVALSSEHIELTRFADGEVRPYIPQNIAGKQIVLQCSLYPDPSKRIFELLLVVDALKRKHPKKITAIIPYLPYIRQSRIHREGESLSAEVIGHMLSTSGIDRIITIDVHNESALSFFSIPVIHISAIPLIASRVQVDIQTIVVSPDEGSEARAKIAAEALHVPLVVMEKERPLEKGDAITRMDIHDDVKGKTAVIVDDIISTGGTIVHAATLLRKAGAKKVIVFAVHAVFAGDAKSLLEDAGIDRLIVTDTISRDTSDLPKGTEIVSTTSLLADPLQQNPAYVEKSCGIIKYFILHT